MTEAYVVDASVAVEYLLKTRLGTLISDQLDRSVLVAPEMLDAEVVSVLRREVIRGRLEEKAALAAINELVRWNVDRVSHHTIALLAWRHHKNVSAYDALYVATAVKFDLPVLTIDAKLSRAPGLNIVIHDLRIRP